MLSFHRHRWAYRKATTRGRQQQQENNNQMKIRQLFDFRSESNLLNEEQQQQRLIQLLCVCLHLHQFQIYVTITLLEREARIVCLERNAISSSPVPHSKVQYQLLENIYYSCYYSCCKLFSPEIQSMTM